MSAYGEEVVPAPADDFEQEVESLRRNQDFQKFLDRRAASGGRIALSDLEAEIEQAIAEIGGGTRAIGVRTPVSEPPQQSG